MPRRANPKIKQNPRIQRAGFWVGVLSATNTSHIRMDNSCEKSEFLNKDKSKFDLDILAYFVSTSQLFDAFQADNRDMPAVVTDHDIDLAARVW